MENLLSNRNTESHKGSYGRVALIGGSTGMHGSMVLASTAAMRTGCGYTYTIIPNSLLNIISSHLCENIIVPINDNNSGHFNQSSINEMFLNLDNVDSIAIGMGMGKDSERSNLVVKLIETTDLPLVIDADGINVLKDKLPCLTNKPNIIITPHPGELANILNVSISEVQANRLYYSEYIANKYNITIVLKGHQTIVASKDKKTYINDTGNPGMATAGSGDVLSGMIASLLALGLKPFNAAKLGVYLHGYAGDLAAKEFGEYGMIASDIVLKIPQAIKDYIQ